jgi:transposase
VNQEDILKQSKNIILKLKSKVLGDLSILVDSLSLMIEMIISLCNKHNQAERYLRNVKTKSKVSRCFQSKEGAQVYLIVMSLLSTASKHGVDAYEAFKLAFLAREIQF